MFGTREGGTRHEYPDRTVLASCTGTALRGRETGLFLVSVMNLAKGQKIYQVSKIIITITFYSWRVEETKYLGHLSAFRPWTNYLRRPRSSSCPLIE